MAAWRRAIELSLGDEDTEKLRSIAQSRTEPASRVERARILLAYREDPLFFAVGRQLGLHHQTVQRCVERAVVEGPTAQVGRLGPIVRSSASLRLTDASSSAPTTRQNLRAGILGAEGGLRFAHPPYLSPAAAPPVANSRAPSATRPNRRLRRSRT